MADKSIQNQQTAAVTVTYGSCRFEVWLCCIVAAVLRAAAAVYHTERLDTQAPCGRLSHTAVLHLLLGQYSGNFFTRTILGRSAVGCIYMHVRCYVVVPALADQRT